MADPTGAPGTGAAHRREPPDDTRPVPGAGSGRSGRWADRVILAVLAVGTVALGVLLRTPVHPQDAWSYIWRGAATFPDSSWNAAGYSRYGIILPLAAVVKVFGQSQTSEYLMPLLAAAWTSVVVFLITRRMFGRVAALAAVVLTLLNSIVFSTTTRIYPDNLSVPVIATAVLLAMWSADEAGRQAPRARRLTVLLVGVGFMLGLSFAVRETSVFAWPVIAWVLLRGVPLRRLLLPVALPALFWLVLELVINQLAHGDAFVRLKLLVGADLAGNGIGADQTYPGQTRRAYLMMIPHHLAVNPRVSWLLVAGVLAVVGTFTFRRKVGVVGWWFLLTGGLLVLTGGLLDPQHPSIRLDHSRYWITFLAPMIIAAVGTLCEVVRLVGDRVHASWTRGTARLLVAVLLGAVLCAWPVYQWARWVEATAWVGAPGATGMERLRDHLAATLPAGTTVWASPYGERAIEPYQVGPFGGPTLWHAHLKVLRPKGPQPAAGDRIVIIPASTCPVCMRDLSAWDPFEHGPRTSTWTLEWEAPQGAVYVYRQG